MTDNELQEFLKETKFCDFSDSEIQKLAKKVAENCKDDREIAVSAFYWVRDNILYRVGKWQRKASQTLVEKKGTCTNKSNLLVALLRANSIPAGYGVMKIYGQRYFGPIAIPMLSKFIGEKSVHSFTTVYNNGAWVKCDPSTDKRFSESTSYFNFTTNLVEWDGTKDAMMNFRAEDVIKGEYPIANIDAWMLKKSKNAKGIPLNVANIYIEFSRNNTLKVSNEKEFERLFKNYLKSKYPFYFYLFKIVSFGKDIKKKFKGHKRNGARK